jgi:hypothetical protein
MITLVVNSVSQSVSQSVSPCVCQVTMWLPTEAGGCMRPLELDCSATSIEGCFKTRADSSKQTETVDVSSRADYRPTVY